MRLPFWNYLLYFALHVYLHVNMCVCVQTTFSSGIRKSTGSPEEQALISNEGGMRARMVSL